MKCIFIDIDGTLYDHMNNRVLPSSIEAINKTRELGNKVIICTGRSLCESKQFLNYDVDGFVFCAGSVVYADKKMLYKKPFEKEVVHDLVKKFKMLEMGFCLDGDAGAYCNEYGYEFVKKYFILDDDAMAVQYATDNGFYLMPNFDDRDYICKICVYGKNEEEIDKANFLNGEYNLTTTLNNHEKELFCREITFKDHNKSFGAKKVLDYYGLSFEDAIAIGDSDNDIDLIDAAGIGIAMGNGSKGVKDVADYISDDASNDGIYKAMKKFNLI